MGAGNLRGKGPEQTLQVENALLEGWSPHKSLKKFERHCWRDQCVASNERDAENGRGHKGEAGKRRLDEQLGLPLVWASHTNSGF